MASVTFDRLWEAVYVREGELEANAIALATVYKIGSAVEAIKLARRLQEDGRPFFEYVDAIYSVRKKRIDDRRKSRGQMSPFALEFLKDLLSKAKKGL